MVRCNMLRRWQAGLPAGAERVMSLAILAICFCVAKIANATIGVLVMTKQVAPCARPGGAGAGHWRGSLAWVIGHLGAFAMRQKSALARERGAQRSRNPSI